MDPSGVKNAILRTMMQLQICFVVLATFYVVLWGFSGGNNEALIHVVLPVGVLVALTFFAVRLVKCQPILIWTPIPWFFIACATYYGFVPMVQSSGSRSIAYVGPEVDVVRANLLDLGVIVCAILGIDVGVRLLFVDEDRRRNRSRSASRQMP